MQELYQMIPKVDFLMHKMEMLVLEDQYGREAVLDVLRKELNDLRKIAGELSCGEHMEAERTGAAEHQVEKTRGKSSGASAAETGQPGQESEPLQTARERFASRLETLEERVRAALIWRERRRFRQVINATGTVLHTNLGRAPLSPELVWAAADKLAGYSNLEYSLEEGCRGERCGYLEELLTELTGAQAALVVNNNAAGVLLALSALAAGKEVVVSRGELVEIGGKFRIPDVITQGGARLREVGTTNKTRLEDYMEALGEETGVVLKVHASNFTMRGFTEEVEAKELAGLGAPLVWDLGSGALIRIKTPGMPQEPTVREAVSQGADVVCFSGDKLLGGPQAGILVGKQELIDRIRSHPLMRAVRVGKLTAAMLETVLEEYERGEENARKKIPTLRMLEEDYHQVFRWAVILGYNTVCWSYMLDGKKVFETSQEDFEEKGALVHGWQLRVEPRQSLAGGGTLPDRTFPGAALTAAWTGNRPGGAAWRLNRKLRQNGKYPVIACIEKDKLWLDARTVDEEEIFVLAETLAGALLEAAEEEAEDEADHHRDGGTY